MGSRIVWLLLTALVFGAVPRIGVAGKSPTTPGGIEGTFPVCDLRVVRTGPFNLAVQPVSYQFENLGPETCDAFIVLGVKRLGDHTFVEDPWIPDSSPLTSYSVTVARPTGMPGGLEEQCRNSGGYAWHPSGGSSWRCSQTLQSGQSIIVQAYVPPEEWPDNCVDAGISGWPDGHRTGDAIPYNGGGEWRIDDPNHNNNTNYYSCRNGGSGSYNAIVRWTKTASASSVTLGNNVTFQITATNAALSSPFGDASQVQTIDYLPVGLEYVSSSAPADSSCSYNAAQRKLTCKTFNLPASSSRTYSVVTTTSAIGEIVNACSGSARNGAGTATGVTVDDTACAAGIVVTGTPSLVATKVASAGTVPALSPISWTITVTNSGSAAATDVSVTDTVPAGVTAITANGTGWSCGVSGQIVTCTRPSLAAGANASITIAGTAPAAAGSITNTCTVTAPGSTSDSTDCLVSTVITPRSSVTFTKTAAPNPVAAGMPITWTVTASNAGPNAATNVVMTDTVPTGVTGIAASGAGWNCSVSGQVVTCTRASLPVGSSAITITGNAPLVAGTIHNVCVASADANVTIDTSNCQSDTVVTLRSELVLSKIVSAASIPAGLPLTWTITATNQGPTTANNVVVTDNVPAGVTSITSSGAGWSCSVSGQVVTCSRATMAVGSSTITINGNAPLTTGTITNTCTGTASTDPSVDSTACVASTTITPRSIIAVSKTGTPAVVQAGGAITWTVGVQNDGPSTASNLVVTDTVPAGVTGIAASGAGWACSVSGQVVTCNRASLPVGFATITITGNAPFVPGNITNLCTATAGSGGVVDYEACHHTIRVEARSDVTVSKTAVPNPVAAGEQITWQISVANAGPSPAYNVVVTDTLPAGVTNITASSLGWACSTAGQVVTCTRATVPVGTTGIVIRGNAPLEAGEIENVCVAEADASSTINDANCHATTVVEPNVHVIATKTASASAVDAGDPISWTIEVQNAGPGDAHDVVVTDTVPAGVTGISMTAPDWSCALSGQVVTCERAAMPAGTSTIQIAGNAPLDAGTITNVCVVTASDDPGADSSACRVSTVVGANAQIVVTKTATPNPVSAGAAITWTLSVLNQGPGNATDVQVTDTLPAGVTNIAFEAPGWTCGIVGQVVTCDLPFFAPGSSTITITGNAPVEPGPITNTCVAEANAGEPADTSACEVTTVVTEFAEVIVSKRAVNDMVDAGEPVEWIIDVENMGPSMARDLVITDTVPEGVTNIVATSPDGFACVVTGNFVDCSLANLPIGTAEIHISGNAPLTAGELPNICAAVAASVPAPDDQLCESTIYVLSNYSLGVIKTAATEQVPISGTIVWTIEVNNSGPGTATNVIVTDTMPAGVTNVVADGAGWSCDGDDTEWVCTRPTLEAGSSQITVTATAPSEPGPITNTCVVSTNETKVSQYACEETTVVVEDARIETIKTATPNPVGTGETITWTIQVINHGPNAATDVEVTDDLPAGVTNPVASADAPWSCSVTGTHVSCLAASLPVGSTSIVIQATAPLVAGTITNTCVSTAPESATPTDDSNCTVDTVVDPYAEVSVVKTASSGTVVAGNPISWTLAVTNSGPGIATNVVVTDTVPAGVTAVTANPGAVPGGAWSCSVAGLVVTCSTPTMDPGASSIVIDGTAPLEAGPITNVCVLASDADPTPDDSQCQATTVVDGDWTVTAVKTASAPTVPAGEPISWLIEVTNHGPSTATDVVVTDSVPKGVSDVTASGPGWACTVVTTMQVTCTRPTLEVGVSSIVIAGTAPDRAGSITNTCAIETALGPADSSLCLATTVITENSEVSVTKTVDASTVLGGEEIIWRLHVHQTGPGIATDVVVTDAVPDGVTNLAVEAGAGWICTIVGQVVTCSADEMFETDSEIVIRGNAPMEAGVIRNLCVLEAYGHPQPTDACDVITTVETPNLTVVKTTSTPNVEPGGAVAWTILVTNHGPGAAQDVIVTDTMPDGVTDITASGAGWACMISGSVIVCTIDELAEGAHEIQITGTAPDEPGSLRNLCVAEADGAVFSTAQCDSTVVVDPPTEITVAKRAAQAIVPVGGAIEWIITVTNSGQAPASDVVVTDTMPDGVTDITVSGAGWSCAVAGQVVTCSRPSLEVGTSEIRVGGTAPNEPVSLRNTCVAAVSGEPQPAPACDATIEVHAPELAVEKRSETSSVLPGGTIAWVITVTNSGDVAASDVVVTDTMPDGVTDITASGAGWSCAVAGQVVTCSRPSLEVGTSEIRLTGTAPTQSGSIRNTCVLAALGWSDAGMVCESTTVVGEVVDLAVTKTGTVMPDASSSDMTMIEWTITVRNQSQTAASNVALVDTWPAGMSVYLSGRDPWPEGWACEPQPGSGFRCDKPQLSPGETHTFLVFGQVQGAIPPNGAQYTNVVEVSTSSDDSDASNNRARATVTLAPPGGQGDPQVHAVPALDWRGLLVLIALMGTVVGVLHRRMP